MPEDMKKLHDSISAVELAEKSMLIGGSFVTIFYIIYLLAQPETYSLGIELFGKNVGISIIALLYGMLGKLILMSVKERLKKYL